MTCYINNVHMIKNKVRTEKDKEIAMKYKY